MRDDKTKKRRQPAANQQLPLFLDPSASAGLLVFSKVELLKMVSASAEMDLGTAKQTIRKLKESIENSTESSIIQPQLAESGVETISLGRAALLAELDQVLAARTLERARYYLKRLERGITTTRNGRINDINVLRWKEYTDIVTDSLWVLPKRDSSGAHLGWYWGNFVPQIPNQMMLRFTKKGDWVLDPFAGSGTTLIECRRLGRNGLGIELNPEVAARAREMIGGQDNPYGASTGLVEDDARTCDIPALLAKAGIDSVQLLILHPPYSDIIRFSEDDRDLSNSGSVEGFLRMFGEVVDNVSPHLEKGRCCALVVGDKYSKGEWIPLGFYCMQAVLSRGYSLKSIVVKNFEETRAKRDQKQLWRYRALVGGFYIFKHEYVFLFTKS
ncbi:MAG TPA: DNA methyltransferase [Blastocatellia bacterium]|nr:DNA methyltransferase [Blastocatellia bacterium]